MSDVMLRPELYCVVPRHLADDLIEPLREAFAAQDVNVIQERRDMRAHVPLELRRQRALHLPRALPPLPENLAEHADELKLVQRMPSPGLAYADHALLEVVDAARNGDGVAASELVWRMHGRISSRLARHIGEVTDTDRVDRVLGRVLDRLDEYSGHSESDFLRWLDRVADES